MPLEVLAEAAKAVVAGEAVRRSLQEVPAATEAAPEAEGLGTWAAAASSWKAAATAASVVEGCTHRAAPAAGVASVVRTRSR
jgi:hypothetical protein